MLSKDHQLPAPLTSSVHLSFAEGTREKTHVAQWNNIKMEADLRLAIGNEDVPSMRGLAEKLKTNANYENTVGTLIYEYAHKKDAVRCALVLKHVAPHASPMRAFWLSLVHEDPNMLAWIGLHDELARYIFLPMPCPTREWCIDNNVDRKNPKPAFQEWWAQRSDVLRQAVADHLRVEWARRFIAQPKLYYLLQTPTVEQAVFVACRPEAIWDFPVLSKQYPDIESVYNITHALYEGTAARKQMMEYFAKAGAPIESYDLTL